VGARAWQLLGTDDNAPYRVFHDVSGYATGTMLEYRVVVKDAAGRVSATSSFGLVGTPAPAGGGEGNPGPVTQPEAVSVPGDLDSELGCAADPASGSADWRPDCAQAQLALDSEDGIWKLTDVPLPAGTYSYKVAINKTWDENYGAGGVRNGSNISVTTTGQPVSFYYDHRTHYVTSSAQGDLITAPGTWNSELGCAADSRPDCMRPWLQDPDGDRVYTWASTEVPKGDYEFTIAHNLSTDVTYGAGGVRNGPAVRLSVPEDGLLVRVSYNLDTHEILAAAQPAATLPSLEDTKGVWVTPGLIAWPRTSLTLDPALLQFRLHWGATGSLELDAEDISGGSSVILRYDPRGLPAAVTSAHPELKDYLALRVPRATARQLPQLAAGDVAVGAYANGRLVDAARVNVDAVR
jgi:hypothetical protein